MHVVGVGVLLVVGKNRNADIDGDVKQTRIQTTIFSFMRRKDQNLFAFYRGIRVAEKNRTIVYTGSDDLL